MLALAVLGRRRKPAPVDDQTLTSSQRQTVTALQRSDPMFYLQDNFGNVNWKKNATFAGDIIKAVLQAVQHPNIRTLTCCYAR